MQESKDFTHGLARSVALYMGGVPLLKKNPAGAHGAVVPCGTAYFSDCAMT